MIGRVLTGNSLSLLVMRKLWICSLLDLMEYLEYLMMSHSFLRWVFFSLLPIVAGNVLV